MIEQMFSPDFVRAIGWALVHSLWQGALFALLLGVLLVVLRGYSAQARYVVAVGLFSAFFMAVGFTAYRGYTQSSTETSLAANEQNTPFESVDFQSGQTATSSLKEYTPSSATIDQYQEDSKESLSTAAATQPRFSQRMTDYFNTHLPLIVTLWLMGVLILQLRFLGQFAFVQRLKVYGTERIPSSWAATIQELEERLDIRKPVQYLTSFRVQSPLTIGWLRPAVLFPRALLSELQESQIVAILAHELAHIKRNDFLVNLIQRLLCILFFYHPGIWWMSARIEEEREHCCDDLAIQATGQALGYAKTLIQLKEKEMIPTHLAIAYAGTTGQQGFKQRITRLVSGYLGAATYGEGVVTALILVCSLATAVYAADNEPQDFVADSVTTELKNQEDTDSTIAKIEQVVDLPLLNEDRDIDVLFDNETNVEYEESPMIMPNREDSPLLFNRYTKVNVNDFGLFMKAIYDGNIELVEYFLKHGIKLDQTDQRGFSPLMAAANENHVEIAKLLIEQGVDVNFVNRQGWTALIEAADEGSYETAELLLKSGANVNLRGGDLGITALVMAASEGHLDIVKLLVNNGAEMDGDNRGTSPLHLAAEEGQLAIVELLLDLGANINGQDKEGRTPLSYAAEENQSDVVKLLVNKGADTTIRDAENRTAFNYAAEEGAVEAFEEMSFELNFERDDFENMDDVINMIIDAAEEGQLGIIKRLVDAGADINQVDREGNSAIVLAAREGDLNMVKYLLEIGADANGTGEEDFFSPLFVAAREGDARMTKLLLEKGAQLEATYDYRMVENYVDEGGPNRVAIYENATALIVAIEEGDLETIKTLVNAGADVNARIAKQSYNVGEQFDWREMSEMSNEKLLETQNLNYSSKRWTPLLEAASVGDPEVVKLLLAAGAKANIVTESGETPLSIALRTGHTEIVILLNK